MPGRLELSVEEIPFSVDFVEGMYRYRINIQYDLTGKKIQANIQKFVNGRTYVTTEHIEVAK